MTCPSTHKHGLTGTCYVDHKCRCDDCRQSRAEYQYWRIHTGRSKLVPAIGSQRRLQALFAMGWPPSKVAKRMGVTRARLHNLLESTTLQRRTVATVTRVFDELCMTQPTGEGRLELSVIGKTRAWARRNGWVPPLAWDENIDDPNATPDLDCLVEPEKRGRWAERLDMGRVDDAVQGLMPDLSPLERREAVRILNGRRWSARRIAAHIGCAARTVDRIRGELQLPIYLYNETTYRDVA